MEVRHIEGALDDQLDTIYAKAEEAAKEKYRAEKEQLRKENESLEAEVESWKEVAEEKEVMANIIRSDDRYEPVRLEEHKTYTNEEIHDVIEELSYRVNDMDGSQRRMENTLMRAMHRLDPIDTRFKQRLATLAFWRD
jgi:uncharacterized protein YPO0396